MSKITDTLFGDSGKGAAKSQSKENIANREFIARQAEQARGDILPLFGAAQGNRQLGAQAALDIFGQALPQQASLFTQGNVGAQNVLGQGSQQFQNAILGLPVDRSFQQPQQLQADFSFLNQPLPQFQTSQQALAPPQQQGLGISPELQQLLAQSGLNNRFGRF